MILTPADGALRGFLAFCTNRRAKACIVRQIFGDLRFFSENV